MSAPAPPSGRPRRLDAELRRGHQAKSATDAVDTAQRNPSRTQSGADAHRSTLPETWHRLQEAPQGAPAAMKQWPKEHAL